MIEREEKKTSRRHGILQHSEEILLVAVVELVDRKLIKAPAASDGRDDVCMTMCELAWGDALNQSGASTRDLIVGPKVGQIGTKLNFSRSDFSTFGLVRG